MFNKTHSPSNIRNQVEINSTDYRTRNKKKTHQVERKKMFKDLFLRKKKIILECDLKVKLAHAL